MATSRVRGLWATLFIFSLLLGACAPASSVVPGSAGSTPVPTVVVNPPSVTPEPTAGGPGDHDITVTLDDNGRALELKPGDRFLLKLGEGYTWTVDIADQSIVSRVPNVMVVRGAQGIYEAHQAGQTELTAAGDPQCRASNPPCAMPSLEFRLTLIVR